MSRIAISLLLSIFACVGWAQQTIDFELSEEERAELSELAVHHYDRAIEAQESNFGVTAANEMAQAARLAPDTLSIQIQAAILARQRQLVARNRDQAEVYGNVVLECADRVLSNPNASDSLRERARRVAAGVAEEVDSLPTSAEIRAASQRRIAPHLQEVHQQTRDTHTEMRRRRAAAQEERAANPPPSSPFPVHPERPDTPRPVGSVPTN